jgi:hypothetical protein
MTPRFRVEVPDPSNQEIVAKGGDPLKTLCLEEARAFSRWMAENEPNFADGLASWERQAIATYLYKKSRRLDEQETNPEGDVSAEEQDGAT